MLYSIGITNKLINRIEQKFDTSPLTASRLIKMKNVLFDNFNNHHDNILHQTQQLRSIYNHSEPELRTMIHTLIANLSNVSITINDIIGGANIIYVGNINYPQEGGLDVDLHSICEICNNVNDTDLRMYAKSLQLDPYILVLGISVITIPDHIHRYPLVYNEFIQLSHDISTYLQQEQVVL